MHLGHQVFRSPVVAADGVTYMLSPRHTCVKCASIRCPVVAADGVTYEEAAIARHFATFAASAATSTTAGATASETASAAAPHPTHAATTAATTTTATTATTTTTVVSVATSPLTKQRMPHGGSMLVFPNRALKQAIEYWAATNNVEDLLA